MSETELLEHREGPVGYLTLNRPQAMNAINIALANALKNACLRLQNEVRVIVLQGGGANFSVGGDAKELARLRRRGPGGVGQLLEAFRSACEAITSLRVPVVAAVRGYALAGGFELVQCCDVALLGEAAVLGDHHLNMGVVPAGGGSQRLPRIVGRQRALAHLLIGDPLTAAEAVQWGLAYRVYPEAELDQAARELARRLAGKQPQALAHTKALVNSGLDLSLPKALDLELAVTTGHLESPDGLGRLSEAGAAS
jgi:enoyl-CoA hydratase/carnithine racemase